MRTFCCCFPVRIGVLLLAPMTTVGAALLAYTQLYLLINFGAQYDTFEKAIRGALAGITILLGLASLFGLLGAVFARRAMVSFYSNMLWISLIIFTVLGAIELWQLFGRNGKANLINACTTQSDLKTQDLQSFFGISLQGTTDEACKKLADTSAVVIAVLFGVLVLVLMWLIGIVTKYKHQLQERDASRSGWSQGRSQRFGNIDRGEYHQPRDMDEGKAGLLQTTTAPAGWKDASRPHQASDPYATYNKA